MQFEKFNSIENTYRTKFVEQVRHLLGAEEPFVVQEKIHGANFSFWCNKDGIFTASRNKFLEPGANFFNWEQVLEKYRLNIQNLYDMLNKPTEVILYGEIYGGNYPHDNVKAVDGAQQVQSKIYYCPHNDFHGFDIKVDGVYLPVDEVNRLCETCGIPYARTLYEGTLEACLQYPNQFITTLPSMHNCPPIKGNTCEGIVIKPKRPAFLPGGERVILKDKNKKFVERTHTKRQILDKKNIENNTIPNKVYDAIIEYATENRLRNVLSKIGGVTHRDFGRILRDMKQDVQEDFDKDHISKWEPLNVSETKYVHKRLNTYIATMIKENLEEIVAGTF